MDLFDTELQNLIARGKAQGHLTYDEVVKYLPDQAVDPSKLDNLLVALDELGIELVSTSEDDDLFADDDSFVEDDLDGVASSVIESLARNAAPPEPERWSNDPIRVYLSQMSNIPLLSREAEVSLAKKSRSHDVAIVEVFSAASTALKRQWIRCVRSMTAIFHLIARSRFRSPNALPKSRFLHACRITCER